MILCVCKNFYLNHLTVFFFSSKDRVTLGKYRYNDKTTTQNNPEEVALLKDLGGILEAGGSTVTIVPEIQRAKFAKNFWNVAFSSFATLTKFVSSISSLTDGQIMLTRYVQL